MSCGGPARSGESPDELGSKLPSDARPHVPLLRQALRPAGGVRWGCRIATLVTEARQQARVGIDESAQTPHPNAAGMAVRPKLDPVILWTGATPAEPVGSIAETCVVARDPALRLLDALLDDPRIDFEGLSGSSAGAMNAVMLACRAARARAVCCAGPEAKFRAWVGRGYRVAARIEE